MGGATTQVSANVFATKFISFAIVEKKAEHLCFQDSPLAFSAIVTAESVPNVSVNVLTATKHGETF